MVHFCTRPLICTFLVRIYRQLMNDVKWSYVRRMKKYSKKMPKSTEYRYGFHMGAIYYFPKCAFLQFMVHNNNTNILIILYLIS